MFKFTKHSHSNQWLHNQTESTEESTEFIQNEFLKNVEKKFSVQKHINQNLGCFYIMLRCRTCGTNYNVTFTQCPFCGTQNPRFVRLKKPKLVIDKLSLCGKDLDAVEEMHANKVTTAVSFHIPFLLHLVNGAYEMKHNKYWVTFQLERVNEPPRVYN